ncbi:PH domain-containing protein [Bacillus sp. NPDC094106]|uniref:PH domain-containing protein n=1 Tax=Bacillus sp. NPDC094106 TaxID=3363949 RepID=UPI0038183297
MVFKTKRGILLTSFMIFITVSIGLATIAIPLSDIASQQNEFIGGSLWFLTIGLMITYLLAKTFIEIRYIFAKKYLLVKSGYFRSYIAYEDIEKVTKTKNILVGYRIAGSSDAIEIFYKLAPFGSIKISPKEQEKFVTELRKRCPNMVVDIDIK